MLKKSRYIDIRQLLITKPGMSTPTDLDDSRCLRALKTSDSEAGAKYYD
jgi:hypothetical protein